ncbi:c-type cytochrome [Persephonella sp.]
MSLRNLSFIIFIITFIINSKSVSETLSGEYLFKKYQCGSCHDIYKKAVGPSFYEISKRYGQSDSSVEKVAKLIINPKPSNWPGYAYMPPFKIPFEEALILARYVLIESLNKENRNEEESDDIHDILDSELQFH